MGNNKATIILSGLGNPGKMAKIIGQSILGSVDYDLAPYALTGPNQPSEEKITNGGFFKIVGLVEPKYHEEVLQKATGDFGRVCAIDACKGEGVANRNAELYCKAGIPFVMLSTGADYDLIKRFSAEHDNPCVAAPNMDPQIVSFMDGVKYMAENYPGSWEGYLLKLSETHQADKVDKQTGLPETSGTMKAMLKNLGALTSRDVSIDKILSERDPEMQQNLWAVPENWIGWHAYHIFHSYKEHDNVEDSLTITLKRHGGECYRFGAMKALDWLVSERYTKPFNTMFDVLKVKK